MAAQFSRQGVPSDGIPPLGEALRFWWKLGWISFGGTAAHLSLMHGELVERRRWLDSEHFFHALSLCMLLPGPEAQQMAIYIGWKLHGKLGGVLAGTLFVLPSMLILLLLSLLYGRYGQTTAVIWFFRLLKPIVVVLVLRALIRIGRRALKSPIQWSVAALCFVAITIFHISLLWAMGVTLLSGFLYGLGCKLKGTHSPRHLGRPASTPSGNPWPFLRILSGTLLLGALRALLRLVTSVVVAALAQLTLFLLEGVLLPDGMGQWRRFNGWGSLEVISILLGLSWFIWRASSRERLAELR